MIGGAIGARALADGGADGPKAGLQGGVSRPAPDARRERVRREERRVTARREEQVSWA